MRIHIFTCIAILWIGLSGIKAPLAEDHQPLAEFFGDVAVGNGTGARLVKWQTAPAIRLETLLWDEAIEGLQPTPTDKELFRSLGRFSDDLAELSGLPVRLLPNDVTDDGDIVITLVPLTKMRLIDMPGVPQRMHRRLLGPGRCFFVIWPSPNGYVDKAHIVINSLLDNDHIKHCFIEELTQSFGLPHDSEGRQPSIFNESRMLLNLSADDRQLIQTLYDSRMPTGIDRRTAVSKFTEILAHAHTR